MITVGGIELNDLQELRATWTREGNRYTSPDGTIVVWIGAGATIGAGDIVGAVPQAEIQTA